MTDEVIHVTQYHTRKTRNQAGRCLFPICSGGYAMFGAIFMALLSLPRNIPK